MKVLSGENLNAMITKGTIWKLIDPAQANGILGKKFNTTANPINIANSQISLTENFKSSRLSETIKIKLNPPKIMIKINSTVYWAEANKLTSGFSGTGWLTINGKKPNNKTATKTEKHCRTLVFL